MDSNATPRGGQGKRESARTFGEAAGKAAGRGGQDSGHTNTTTRQGKASTARQSAKTRKEKESHGLPVRLWLTITIPNTVHEAQLGKHGLVMHPGFPSRQFPQSRYVHTVFYAERECLILILILLG